MTTFILVSGAWHGGWCWERVTPLLEAAGHRALAPDLAGMGEDPTPLSKVTLALWADQIADLIRAEAEPVVLVGHSRAGVVISEAAERVPERIRRLVYLTAYLVPSGDALLTAAARRPVPELVSNIVRGGDRTSTFRPEAVGEVFYNTTAPEWVARAISRLGPEPAAGSNTPVKLTAERFGSVPRAYVECLRDRAIPLALQRELHHALPCDPVLSLDTDHSPFYSAPELLCEHLLTLA